MDGGSFGVVGGKPKTPRQADSQNWQDMFGFSALVAADLVPLDINKGSYKNATTGEYEERLTGTFLYVGSAAIDYTDYANMGIGSIIVDTQAATKTIAVKLANSSPSVIGDWYDVNLAVVA